MNNKNQVTTQIKRNDSGIYYIKNQNNKKLYIGQSVRLGERAKNHIAQLENGTSPIKEMQEDYNKGDRFHIGIVQKAPKNYLDGLEVYYTLKWNTHIVGYNTQIGFTYNFDEALKAMITPKQLEQIEEEKQQEELKIIESNLYKDSSLHTIQFLMNRNNWTIDDVFLFFKNVRKYKRHNIKYMLLA